MTLQRLSQKPHSDKFPPFGVFSNIGYLGDPKNAAATEWKKKNTWFKADAVVKAIGDLVTDPAVGYTTKASAVSAAVALGATKKDLEAWKMANEKDASLKKKLDDEIAKAK